MKLKDFDEFQEECINGVCLRNTIQSKNCLKDYKQQRCYEKWSKKHDEKMKKLFEPDIQWEVVRSGVEIRDNMECQLWRILTKDEKAYIMKNHLHEYMQFDDLDCAHIKGKGSNPELKYEVSNIVLIRRYFHSLLDTLKHPVTQEDITSEEREHWLRQALEKRRFENE